MAGATWRGRREGGTGEGFAEAVWPGLGLAGVVLFVTLLSALQVYNGVPYETSVRSDPSRRTSISPKGNV